MFLIDTTTFVTIILGVATISMATCAFLILIGREIIRRGKARIIWHDPDGNASPLISWHRIVNGNEIIIGDKRYILQQAARLSAYPPTWVLHPRHGFNYVGLSDAETADRNPLIMRLTVANPASYHFAMARNRARDALNANADEDRWGWIKPIALFGLVAIVAVLFVVGFIAWKITSAAGA